jgi:hypothetical protein
MVEECSINGMTSENVMVPIKPNMKKYNCSQNLLRHNQVVVSRLRMGYTRITQAYRLDNSPQPECQTWQRTLSVPHILWNAETSNLNVCGMKSTNKYWLTQWKTLQT